MLSQCVVCPVRRPRLSRALTPCSRLLSSEPGIPPTALRGRPPQPGLQRTLMAVCARSPSKDTGARSQPGLSGSTSLGSLWSLLTAFLSTGRCRDACGLRGSRPAGRGRTRPPDASSPRAPATEGGYAGGLWPPSSCAWGEGRPGPEALWPQVGSARPLSQAVSSRLRKRVFNVGLGGLALAAGGGEPLRDPPPTVSALSGLGVGSFLPGLLTLGAGDF